MHLHVKSPCEFFKEKILGVIIVCELKTKKCAELPFCPGERPFLWPESPMSLNSIVTARKRKVSKIRQCVTGFLRFPVFR